MKRSFVLILTALCLLFSASSCKPVTQERHLFAMDTVMSFRLEGDNGTAFALCQKEVEALEQMLSTTLPQSEIYQLNQQGTATLSAPAAGLVQAGLNYSAATKQAFCLSLYPATRLWNFTGSQPYVPTAAELQALQPLADDTKIKIDQNTVTLPAGAAIDLGAIAKGYTGDRLAALLAQQGVEHYFLSLGGNVQVGGGNPNGTPWRVGIADPKGGEYVGIVTLKDGAVVTSGGYQRNFTHNETVYHHILDRATLAPAQSGLTSVTVVAQNGTMADAFSTALFVMGEQQALEFCAQRGDFECILITEDNRVVVSEGLKQSFTLHNTAYQYV